MNDKEDEEEQKRADEFDHTYTIPIFVSIVTSVLVSCLLIWLLTIFGK